MQDHLDARKFTIVERYVNESSQKYVSALSLSIHPLIHLPVHPPIHPPPPLYPQTPQLINQPPQFTDIISKTPTGKPSTPTSNPSSPKKWIFDATTSWISVRRSKLCRMRLCGMRWRSIRTRRIAEGYMYLGYVRYDSKRLCREADFLFSLSKQQKWETNVERKFRLTTYLSIRRVFDLLLDLCFFSPSKKILNLISTILNP